MPHRDIGRFVRFCVVGVGNTLVHTAVVVALVEGARCRPTYGNVAAFMVANLVSYLVNSHWTFQASASLKVYGRFLAVSLIGAGISMAAMALALKLHFHYLVGVAASVVAVAVVGYGLNCLFVFRHPKREGG